MTQQLSLEAATQIDLHQITQFGRLASCMIRLNLQDLNTEGKHRTEAQEWFSYADSGAASLSFCAQALANLNRYLSAHAPKERSALPHLSDLMPENVQDPDEWKAKLIEVAQPDSLDPEVISQRHKAGLNIEALTDALVDECRDVHHHVTHEVGVRGASQPGKIEADGVDQDGYGGADDGPIMRL